MKDFTEMMYNHVYFSENNNCPGPNEEEEDEEYSEYLMDDYSTFYTDYDQMATFAAPLNRQPSLSLKKASSSNEGKSAAVPSFPNIALSKRDSNVQTDDISFMKLSGKSSSASKASKSSKGVRHSEVSDISSDENSFFYRLKESAPKVGIIKETRVRKVFAPENHGKYGSTPYLNNESFDGNHLSESMALSRAPKQELQNHQSLVPQQVNSKEN